MKRLLAAFALLLLEHSGPFFATRLFAQGLQIVRTEPAEDATGVDTATTVSFRLDRALPAFGTAFATKFFWSPADSTRLFEFGHAFDENGSLRVVFFKLDQRPATDVTFVAYGVEAADGTRMDRPFVLNYTTAPSNGAHTVGGSVAPGARSLAPPAAIRLMSAVRHMTWPAVQGGAAGRAGEPAHGRPGEAVRQDVRPSPPAAKSGASSADISRAVVLLLERYELDGDRWHVRKGAVPAADGTFVFDHVRDGVYWPVAFTYADETGTGIDAYGFYDADGDLVPDSIQVSGDVAGVDLTLFAYGPFTAGQSAALARAVAARTADDQQFVHLQALAGPSFGAAYDDGTADIWRYTFYSAAERLLTYVAVDPINLYVSTEPEEEYDAVPLPEAIVDSDAALRAAEEHGGRAFRAQYGPEAVRVSLEAGDLELSFRPAPSEVFWRVRYTAPPGYPPAQHVVFVDAETGAVLEGQSVSRQPSAGVPADLALLHGYPNPLASKTEIAFTLPEPGAVTVRIYDVAGRAVATLWDGHQTAGSHTLTWDARGVPNGVYLCHLETPRGIRSRALVVAR